jgi:hypothetical protein
MAKRVGSYAPVGSMLRKPARKAGQKRGRDPRHLELIRQAYCLACPSWDTCDAAHVRYHDMAAGKEQTGIGRKPDDRWVVPLCHRCHMTQHSRGERIWWQEKGIDPVRVARLLYAASPNFDKMLSICLQVRAGIAIM